MPIEFRLAEPEHAPAIARVLYESFVQFKALYTEGGFAATALDAAQILVRMQEGPVWIALRRNEIIGTVAAMAKGDSLYIRGMAVLPGARAAGIGSRLLQEAEKFAERGEFKRIFFKYYSIPFLCYSIV